MPSFAHAITHALVGSSRCFVQAALVAFAVFASNARAQGGSAGCAEGSRARVAVTFDGPGWSADWAQALPAELATEIAVAGLCETPADAASDAQIVLRFRSTTSIQMQVRSGEGDAQRSVSRTVDLAPLPLKQWAFAVGVSASEVLREAREVIPVLRKAETPVGERRWRLSVRAHSLLSSGGVSLVGAELSAAGTFGRLVTEVAASLHGAPPLGTGSGASVDVVAPGGSVMLGVRAWESEGASFSLDAGALLDARWLSLHGNPTSASQTGLTKGGLVLAPLAVATLWFGSGAFQASLRAGVGGVARGVSAQAAGVQVGAYSGLVGTVSVGAGVRW